MAEMHCRACGATWKSPESTDPEVIRQVAAALLKHGGAGGIKAIRDRWGLTP